MMKMMGQKGGPQMAKMMKAAASASSSSSKQQPKQQKQAAPVDNVRNELNEFVKKQTGEKSTKDSILYSTVEVEDSRPTQFISTVVVMTVNPEKIYTGEPQPSKKTAEASAAKAALQHLKKK